MIFSLIYMIQVLSLDKPLLLNLSSVQADSNNGHGLVEVHVHGSKGILVPRFHRCGRWGIEL